MPQSCRGDRRLHNLQHVADNGSVADLDEAVRVMAKTQLDVELPPETVADIVAFLKSLTNVFPAQTFPQLPPSEGTSLFGS